MQFGFCILDDNKVYVIIWICIKASTKIVSKFLSKVCVANIIIY